MATRDSLQEVWGDLGDLDERVYEFVSELTLFTTLRYTLIIALLSFWLTPVYTIVYLALKPTEALAEGFWAMPDRIAFVENLMTVWTQGGFREFAINSFLYATIGGLSAVFLASMAGFALARLDIRGARKWLFLILLFTFFPFQMYLIPLVKGFHMLNIYNTRFGLTVVYTAIAIPFAAFLLRNYFTTVPQSLYESARIDGLSDLQIYWKIYLPLAKPAFAVGVIFQWRWIWNEFLFGLVLAQGEQARPIATGLIGLSGRFPQWNLIAAGTILTAIPTVILFLLFQRYFVRGLVSGVEY